MRILERESSRLVVHASTPADTLSSVVLWLGGTPHTGALLEPVVAAAASVRRDVVSLARPGYGGAPPPRVPDRGRCRRGGRAGA